MKSWYKSKTIWVAIISVSIAGLEAYQNGATGAAIALAVLGAALFVIRPGTDQKLIK